MLAMSAAICIQDGLNLVEHIALDDCVVLAGIAFAAMVDFAEVGAIAQEGDQRFHHEWYAADPAAGGKCSLARDDALNCRPSLRQRSPYCDGPVSRYASS